MICNIPRCTNLPSDYAASTGTGSIGPLFTSKGSSGTGATGGTSEAIRVAVVIIEEAATIGFIVSKDESRFSGSVGAIKEALTVEFPMVYIFLFAIEFVSHITIRIPCLRPTRAIVSNFQAQPRGMEF